MNDLIALMLVMHATMCMTHNMNLDLQVDGTGNCLFSSIKKSMSVHTATSQEATYFPNRYFRRMVVNFMVNH